MSDKLRKLTPAYAIIYTRLVIDGRSSVEPEGVKALFELVDFADTLYDLLKEANSYLHDYSSDLGNAVELRRSTDTFRLEGLEAFVSRLDALFAEHPAKDSTKPKAAPGWYGDWELCFFVEGQNVFGVSSKRGMLPDGDHRASPVVFVGKLDPAFPEQLRNIRMFDQTGESFGASAGDIHSHIYRRVHHFLTEAKRDSSD